MGFESSPRLARTRLYPELGDLAVFVNHSCLKTFPVMMTIKPSLLPPYNVLLATAVVTPSYPVKSV